VPPCLRYSPPRYSRRSVWEVSLSPRKSSARLTRAPRPAPEPDQLRKAKASLSESAAQLSSGGCHHPQKPGRTAARDSCLYTLQSRGKRIPASRVLPGFVPSNNRRRLNVKLDAWHLRVRARLEDCESASSKANCHSEPRMNFAPYPKTELDETFTSNSR
jgi:hypothetical protein